MKQSFALKGPQWMNQMMKSNMTKSLRANALRQSLTRDSSISVSWKAIQPPSLAKWLESLYPRQAVPKTQQKSMVAYQTFLVFTSLMVVGVPSEGQRNNSDFLKEQYPLTETLGCRRLSLYGLLRLPIQDRHHLSFFVEACSNSQRLLPYPSHI